MNWQELIQERNEWVDHNFPDRAFPNPVESILGVVEEIGELAHAHLKAAQSIRGDGATHEANARDAVGDITIYLLGVMNHYNHTPPSIAPADDPQLETCIVNLSHWAGCLLADAPTAVNFIVYNLRDYCVGKGWDYDEIVQATWDEVKERDWIKFPDTGLPPVDLSPTVAGAHGEDGGK